MLSVTEQRKLRRIFCPIWVEVGSQKPLFSLKYVHHESCMEFACPRAAVLDYFWPESAPWGPPQWGLSLSRDMETSVPRSLTQVLGNYISWSCWRTLNVTGFQWTLNSFLYENTLMAPCWQRITANEVLNDLNRLTFSDFEKYFYFSCHQFTLTRTQERILIRHVCMTNGGQLQVLRFLRRVFGG